MGVIYECPLCLQVMASTSTSRSRRASSSLAGAVQPKCDTPDSRTAAYSLLAELARDCPQNLNAITSKIITMHHSFDQESERMILVITKSILNEAS